MEKSRRTSLLIGALIIILIGVIGITFAYFSTGGIQNQVNTFTSGCLNIELTNESSSINLNNIYPVTDIEGLKGTSYDFTIKNNCSTPTTYQINLESLNEQANSLGADYIKVALSSDTVDPIISKLGNNPSATPEIEGAYESYNLYTTSIGAGEERTYHLKLWLDYDATVEQAASKVYQSKINVIANPEIEVVDTLEATFRSDHTTITSTLTNNVTSATYCISEENICEPTTSATISDNNYTIELEESETEKIVCTRLNGTSKIICSNPFIPIALTAVEVILAEKEVQTRTSFRTTLSDDTTGIVYRTSDEDGTTYYFAGNPTDNWVQFGGFYWRIIRINGNGSVRLIYNGTSTETTGTTTQIQTTSFNTIDNRSEYVGLKYTLGEQHGTTTDSTIMGILNVWYSQNLAGYESYIDPNAGFCNDRNIADDYTWSSQPSNTIYYMAYERIATNKTPSLECNDEDLFTVTGASKGNASLTNPIGLITVDEVAYAGGVNGANNSGYYLYTGQSYSTISAASSGNGYNYVFGVHPAGNINTYGVTSALGVRPVINLRADVQLSGTGTSTDPYVVEGT